MRVGVAVMLVGIVVAEKLLYPDWSFASTTTITDVDIPWYTRYASFLTTITTNVSGIVETITTTKVSISIGTEPPNMMPSTTSMITIPYANSSSGTPASELALEPGSIDARSPPTSTEKLITHTHSHLQSKTIDESDILPTVSFTSSNSSSADSSSAIELSTASLYNESTAGSTKHTALFTASPTGVSSISFISFNTFITNHATSTCDETSNTPTPATLTTANPAMTTTPAIPITNSSSSSSSSSPCNEQSSGTTLTLSIPASEIPTTLLTAAPPTITAHVTLPASAPHGAFGGPSCVGCGGVVC